MSRQAWKSRWAGGGGGGGTPTHFFFLSNFLRHLHYWVGVPSVYQTDLRDDKQKKKKKKIDIAKGGLNPKPPPPPAYAPAPKWYLRVWSRCVMESLRHGKNRIVCNGPWYTRGITYFFSGVSIRAWCWHQRGSGSSRNRRERPECGRSYRCSRSRGRSRGRWRVRHRRCRAGTRLSPNSPCAPGPRHRLPGGPPRREWEAAGRLRRGPCRGRRAEEAFAWSRSRPSTRCSRSSLRSGIRHCTLLRTPFGWARAVWRNAPCTFRSGPPSGCPCSSRRTRRGEIRHHWVWLPWCSCRRTRGRWAKRCLRGRMPWRWCPWTWRVRWILLAPLSQASRRCRECDDHPPTRETCRLRTTKKTKRTPRNLWFVFTC